MQAAVSASGIQHHFQLLTLLGHQGFELGDLLACYQDLLPYLRPSLPEQSPVGDDTHEWGRYAVTVPGT